MIVSVSLLQCCSCKPLPCPFMVYKPCTCAYTKLRRCDMPCSSHILSFLQYQHESMVIFPMYTSTAKKRLSLSFAVLSHYDGCVTVRSGTAASAGLQHAKPYKQLLTKQFTTNVYCILHLQSANAKFLNSRDPVNASKTISQNADHTAHCCSDWPYIHPFRSCPALSPIRTHPSDPPLQVSPFEWALAGSNTAVHVQCRAVLG